MANVRIHEIATELGYPGKEIVEKAQQMGLSRIKSVSNVVTAEEAEAIYNYVQTGELPEVKVKKAVKKTQTKPKEKEPKEQKEIATKKEPKPEPKEPIEEKVSQNSEIEPILHIEEKKEPMVQTQTTQKVLETKVEEKTPKQETKSADTAVKSAESLVSNLVKRRGLVIVKKKKDEESQTAQMAKSQYTKTKSEPLNKELAAMFAGDGTSLRKKKKEKKLTTVSKKEGIQKIELGDRDMSDVILEDDDVVVLPDLTLKPIQNEPKYTPKKQPGVLKQSFNSAFGNDTGGISRRGRKKHKKIVKNEKGEIITNINIPKEIRVYEFADKIQKSAGEIIGKLFGLGMMTTKNDFLGQDEIEILADEFGIEVNIIDTADEFDYVKAYDDVDNDPKNSVKRAPVITIMGHVDHGKTSLLDYIRKSRVASGEAGGITQHVGAYMVQKDGKTITFIDTPGHEAFTSMRARGAEVTDIAIIVVAADDGVKPQTKEAINHAKAAGVPIIIAMNKMDKESANPDRLKTQLAELDIIPIEWGGAYEFVPISAKTGMGVAELLEIVLLQADLLDLEANPDREAKAVIIDSSLQKGRGAVVTLIVENGTLSIGDTIVAGVAYGKVRDLSDDSGNKLKSILPGECGVMVGLSEVPDAGETLIVVKSDKEAREYAQKKYEYLRQKELSRSTKVTLDELSARIAEGELKSLPVIIKTDVQGALEALKTSLDRLRNDEIKVNIVHAGVGGITQNDVALAAASEHCVILGFNIRPTGDVKANAKERGVEIKTYNVIYNLIDDVKAILSGMMSPIISEEEIGQAIIRQVITIPKLGQIAGCMVTEGSISRGGKIRVIRGGVIMFEGNISSLKRFKDDAKEVSTGYECGVGIDGFNDMQEGDYIESFKEVQEKVSL